LGKTKQVTYFLREGGGVKISTCFVLSKIRQLAIMKFLCSGKDF
jgi:hypothetical protein